MDFQPLWNTLRGGALAVGGWILRAIYQAIRELEADLGQHKVEAARTYSTKTDLSRIEDKIDRVLDKLDRKVDR